MNPQAKREIIQRQRQLTCQAREEINQLWEENQREKDELVLLRTKTEQQQEDINRLKAEKQQQNELIKSLRTQIDQSNKELEESRNHVTQEKQRLHKIQAEILRERELLERKAQEIRDEQQRPGTSDHIETQKTEPKEPGDLQEPERLRIFNLLTKNKKMMLDAKLSMEQMKKIMTDTSEELKRNQTDILQHKDQIKHMKDKMNEMLNKTKQLRKLNITDAQTQEGSQEEPTRNFETAKVNLCRILKDMDELWDTMEEGDLVEDAMATDSQQKTHEAGESTTSAAEVDELRGLRESIERERQQLEHVLQMNRKEVREMEIIKSEIEFKRRDLVKMIRKSQRRERDISRSEEEQHVPARQDESEGQRSEQVLEATTEQRFDLHTQEDRSKQALSFHEGPFEKDSKTEENTERISLAAEDESPLGTGEDTDKTGTTSSEEKSQRKWANLRAKKKQRDLDRRQEMITKALYELDMMKMKVQQQKEEIQQEVEAAMSKILTISEIKASTEKAAAEMNDTREELEETQSEMEKNKAEVKQIMVSSFCIFFHQHQVILFTEMLGFRAEKSKYISKSLFVPILQF